MLDIDKIDAEIVKLLIEDGRMPASDISRKLNNVSDRIVRYRIDRLRSLGIIHIGTIVNPKLLGFEVIADIFLEVESGSIEEVAKLLSQNERVSYVACSIGQNDVSVQVVAKNSDEIFEFVTSVVGKIPKVKKSVTSILPIKLKDVYQWAIPSECIHES
jgi:Lrp/AsnC family transcriptional regulator for asnA, asnC and gidA